MESAHSIAMAVFDLDGTLVKGNSSFNFCLYLSNKGVLPRFAIFYALWSYFCFYFGKVSLVDLHKKVFNRLLKGLKLSILETHMELFLVQFLDKAVYLPAVESLRSAQRLGHYTLILSNAPSFLVKKIAAYFRVDAWRATEYAVDLEGKLSHISSILEGKDKAECVTCLARQWRIGLADVTAYTDSHLDLPLLETAGTAVGVNPNRILRKICKRSNWKIL